MKILIVANHGGHRAKMASVLYQAFQDHRTRDGFDQVKGVRVDARDYQKTNTLIASEKPDVVINCTGTHIENQIGIQYHSDYNIIAATHVAMAARVNGAMFIHISTDRVHARLLSPDETPRPDTNLGVAKLMAERAVAAIGGDYYIIRFGDLYGDLFPDSMPMRAIASLKADLPTWVENTLVTPAWDIKAARYVVVWLLESQVAQGRVIHCSVDMPVTWTDLMEPFLPVKETFGNYRRIRGVLPSYGWHLGDPITMFGEFLEHLRASEAEGRQ